MKARSSPWVLATTLAGILGCITAGADTLLWAQSPHRRAIGAIVADLHMSDSALDVHRRASSMAAADRYAYLSDWVLPAESHDTFRLALDFTPTHPAPLVSDNHPIDAKRIELAKGRNERRVHSGGNLISPALDLIAVAGELGKLQPLRIRVAAVAPRNSGQQRERLSLLALIDIALKDFAVAVQDLDTLFPLVEANVENTLAARSAEFLAIHVANQYPQTRGFARDAAANLYIRGVRVPNRGAIMAWESHLMAIMAATLIYDRQASEKSVSADPAVEVSLAPQLAEWAPASRTTAGSRGRGHSLPHWQLLNGQIKNANSHQDDFLYYRIPLQGNYQVECDVQNRDYQNTELVVGGQWVEPLYYSLNKYDFGNLRERLGRTDISPNLTKYYEWVHLRTTVRGQTIEYSINGRVVNRREVGGDVDPWVALRSENRYDGAATDIRITGEPIIPRELRLTASDELTGWYPYFPAQVGKPKATWQQLGDLPKGGGIFTSRRSDLAGMNVERLLLYHRPMFEDGTIEYEFFYRDGVTHVHPALDRLVFLLEPKGVRIHWVTDGEYDRTELDPANACDEPAQRRGPDRLPLIENDWNRLRLVVGGDSVSLHLNDQHIYQRELEITNQRTFGLFHYSDRTDARVRNVRWRGNWPSQLPAVAKQQLANQGSQQLDEGLPKLTAVVQHDFAKDGMPPEKFTLTSSPGSSVEQLSDGLRVNRPGGRGYLGTTIAANLIVAGDFDVIATYRLFDARPSVDGISTAGVRMLMSSTSPQQGLVLRRFIRASKQDDQSVVHAVLRNGATESTLDWRTLLTGASESESGRLRIARRGDRVYYLMADGDSPNFRLLAETTALTGNSAPQAVQLLAQSSGEGGMSVIWKDIVIRAEELTHLPSSNVSLEQTLSVMNQDATGLRRLLPKDSGINGPGSPAWSPDQKQVAFDVYNGSTANSRMYLINADGSNLRDLGIGNMPTFSPDGRRLAFSWGGQGIAVMNSDGTNREVLESNGWGAQWSPDGRIAYARGGNVVVHDLQSKTQREIIEGEQAARYANVYWNLGWSRDGKQICFKARNRSDNQYEIAVVSAAGSQKEFQVLYKSPQEVVADFSWHPDGNRILLSMQMGGGPRLFLLDRKKPGPPQLYPGQPLNHYFTGSDWSADGKQIVFSGQILPGAPAPATNR